MKLGSLLSLLALFWGAGLPRAGAADGPLQLQLTTEPVSLDPSLAEDGLSLRVLDLLMHGLMRYDGRDRLVLALAEKLTPLRDKKGRLTGYEALLRPDARWSDGAPVTAAQFVGAMRRTLSPSTPGKLAELLFFLKGARAYKEGRTEDFATVGVAAAGDRKVRFTLEGPYEFFPHILALAVGYPQRIDAVDKGGRWMVGAPTTGPYRLGQWEESALHLERTGRGADKGVPAKALLRVVTEDATALALFETGKLDVVTRFPYYDLEKLKARGVTRSFPFRATYYIGFNHRLAPWSRVEARRAAAAALDRGAIMALLKGDGTASSRWLPGAASAIPQAPAKSAGLFATDADGERALTLAFDAGSRNQLICERVQSDLKTKLGIDVRLEARDWKTHLRNLVTETPGLFRFGWLSPFLDPYAHLMVFRSDSLNNHTGWRSPRYDAVLDRIAASAEGPARQRLLAEAERILTESDAVVAPLFQYVNTVLVSKRAEGVRMNGLGFFELNPGY